MLIAAVRTETMQLPSPSVIGSHGKSDQRLLREFAIKQNGASDEIRSASAACFCLLASVGFLDTVNLALCISAFEHMKFTCSTTTTGAALS